MGDGNGIGPKTTQPSYHTYYFDMHDLLTVEYFLTGRQCSNKPQIYKYLGLKDLLITEVMKRGLAQISRLFFLDFQHTL